MSKAHPDQLHTIVLLVNNRPGVLNRVSGLLRRRNFNIDSLTVARSERDDTSRMTLTVRGRVDQVIAQLEKLIDVIMIRDITADQTLDRELLFVRMHKLSVDDEAHVVRLAERKNAQLHRGDIEGRMLLEYCGTPAQVDELSAAMKDIGHVERIMRSGRMAMRVL